MSDFNPLPFVQPPTLIVVWSGDRRETIQALGERVVLPAINEVAIEGQGEFRFSSVKDARGQYVPGTVVLRDSVRRGEMGDLIKSFDAPAFVKMLGEIQGKQPDNGVFGRGLAVVMTAEKAVEVHAVNRPAWVKSMILSWEREIESEIHRQENWAQKNPGQKAPTSSSADSVQVAKENLQRYHASVSRAQTHSIDDLKAVLSGSALMPEPSVSAQPEPVAGDDRAYGAMLYDEAEASGVDLKKDLLSGLLRGDAATIKAVEELIQAKTAKAKSA